MKTTAEEEVYGDANMICNMFQELQVYQSNAETEATQRGIVDTDRAMK